MEGNIKKSFKARFSKWDQFQNTFGKKNDQLNESITKPISIIMKLKYPFVVDITDEPNDDEAEQQEANNSSGKG